MAVNETCLEVHDLCFEARGDLSRNLDYGFLARIMSLMDIEADEQLDIIHKIRKVERFLMFVQGSKESLDYAKEQE